MFRFLSVLLSVCIANVLLFAQHAQAYDPAKSHCLRFEQEAGADEVFIFVQYKGLDGKKYLRDLCYDNNNNSAVVSSPSIKYYPFIELYDMLSGKLGVLPEYQEAWIKRSPDLGAAFLKKGLGLVYTVPLLDSEEKQYIGIVVLAFESRTQRGSTEAAVLGIVRDISPIMSRYQQALFPETYFGHSFEDQRQLECGDSSGFEFTSCLFNYVVVGTIDQSMKDHPFLTLILVIIASFSFYFGRKLDVKNLVRNIKLRHKISEPDNVLSLVLTFWDRDLNASINGCLESIFVDELRAQQDARPAFEAVLNRYRDKTNTRLKGFLSEEAYDQISQNLISINDDWLSSLVNALPADQDITDSWRLQRKFEVAMTKVLEQHKESLKRKLFSE